MKLRTLFVVAAIVGVISAVVVLNRKADQSRPIVRAVAAEEVTPHSSFDAASASSLAPARADLDGQPAMSPPDPAELSTSERSPLADLLGAQGTRPEAEVKIVLDVLNAYRRSFGAYPAGEDNRQFMNALLGANKHKLPFLPRDHPRLNSNGELVDAWGTPFFFHMDSRTSIEVRSAGADRLLFTADDIVAGKPARLTGQSSMPESEASAQ